MLTSVLNFVGYREAQRSLNGIGILLAAAVAMPLLANRKRKLAVLKSSAALKADAAESALCSSMAWISAILSPRIKGGIVVIRGVSFPKAPFPSVRGEQDLDVLFRISFFKLTFQIVRPPAGAQAPRENLTKPQCR
jgi:hypothetical protein